MKTVTLSAQFNSGKNFHHLTGQLHDFLLSRASQILSLIDQVHRLTTAHSGKAYQAVNNNRILTESFNNNSNNNNKDQLNVRQ